MSALALRVSAWQNATPTQRRVLRLAGDFLQLGQPARYLNPSAVEHFVFDDLRFSLTHAAYLGKLTDLLADFDGDWSDKTDQEVKQLIKQHVMASVVLPKDIDYEGVDNPWQHTLNANNAPAVLKMAGSVPDTWTPVAA